MRPEERDNPTVLGFEATFHCPNCGELTALFGWNLVRGEWIAKTCAECAKPYELRLDVRLPAAPEGKEQG